MMSSFGALILVLVMMALALLVVARRASSHTKTKKEIDAASVVSIPKKRRKKNNWILPIIIAVIIAIKTIAGGLFFLAIVWLMRLDPKPYSKTISSPSDKDKKNTKGIYNWILLSSFITVPFFLILVSNFAYGSSSNERVLIALTPLILHITLIFGFNSNSSFVYRHTQQAMFLVSLRAGMAALALNIGPYPEDGWGVFVLGNGSLWLFGTVWGRYQVTRGECWWAKQKGETILHTLEQLEMLSPQENIQHSKQLMKKSQADAAINHALMAFRFGDSEIRSQAVDILDELGEVKMF